MGVAVGNKVCASDGLPGIESSLTDADDIVQGSFEDGGELGGKDCGISRDVFSMCCRHSSSPGSR